MDYIQGTFTSWTTTQLPAHIQTNNLPLEVVNCYILSSPISLHPSQSASPILLHDSRYFEKRFVKADGHLGVCLKTWQARHVSKQLTWEGEEAGPINNECALKEKWKIRRTNKHLLMRNEKQRGFLYSSNLPCPLPIMSLTTEDNVFSQRRKHARRFCIITVQK